MEREELKYKKGFMNIQLFGGSNDEGQGEGGDQVDYKAEYEKMLAERDTYKAEAEKQKRMKDQYATENADYKKRAEAQMSEEEKRAKELKDLIDSKNKTESELQQLKLEKECLANGFNSSECAKLIESKFSVKTISEIIKARVDEAVKSAKAEMTKGSTSKTLLGGGNTETTKSAFQKHQESKITENNIVKL